MRTVKQLAKLSGVSVRTLHYYDQIGLLRPDRVTEAGYRLYGDKALERLQQILFFRELDFPLKEIARILDSPGFDRSAAMEEHIKLLTLRRDRLNRLIDLARKGEDTMDFKAFDKEEYSRYAKEAKERWGNTDAYRESLERAKEPERGMEALMDCFGRFGRLLGTAPEAPAVQAEVEALRACISENYYACTKEILASLGAMYTEDERFRQNIDARGGAGTAALVSAAIGVYCGRA